MNKGVEDELSDFLSKLNDFAQDNAPSWLASNSYFMGVMPGHHLDLLQISFDFKIDRAHVLKHGEAGFLADPSKPELKVIK